MSLKSKFLALARWNLGLPIIMNFAFLPSVSVLSLLLVIYFSRNDGINFMTYLLGSAYLACVFGKSAIEYGNSLYIKHALSNLKQKQSLLACLDDLAREKGDALARYTSNFVEYDPIDPVAALKAEETVSRFNRELCRRAQKLFLGAGLDETANFASRIIIPDTAKISADSEFIRFGSLYRTGGNWNSLEYTGMLLNDATCFASRVWNSPQLLLDVIPDVEKAVETDQFTITRDGRGETVKSICCYKVVDAYRSEPVAIWCLDCDVVNAFDDPNGPIMGELIDTFNKMSSCVAWEISLHQFFLQK